MREGSTKWTPGLGMYGAGERGEHQVEHRIGGGRADEREGNTKWPTELEVEGLMRERGTPNGPQNWRRKG